ncbi:Rrf2 family transcriptional regulator [Neomegalonema sp.]|uniref:RrF2 family transcriptional regulator n=1 Tax=Neomegalonema sp. TaxID=2039713 RepID=UPI0026305ABD|nr:Rrf2 family transcriptional regulator [Neomegalonema sp.]MDD2867461.1 Rrf2 family transcriptional regulator [Neomegalonema sp.]
MLSMKGKYGLKALCHLAGLGPDEVARSQEIAAEIGMSKKFLDAILGELREAGLVVARKGRSGGYRLAAPAEEITAESAIRALDGPLAPIRCVSLNFYQRCEDCPDEAACVVRPTMLELRKAMLDVLSRISIARMRAMPDLPGEEEEKATPPARRPLRKPPPEA